MATLLDTEIIGKASQTQAAAGPYDLVRLQEAEALAAAAAATAHAPVTYGDSDSVAFQITAQEITPTARLASGAGLVPGRGRILVASGSGRGLYVELGSGAYDAAPGNHGHAEATADAAGFMGAAHFAKLSAVEAEATKNAADAYLLDRANHTGGQPWTTISDFVAGVTAYALPLEGGEMGGLLRFGAGGRFRLPGLDQEAIGGLTPEPGWALWNTTYSRAEVWTGLEWLPWAAGGEGDMDFTSIYGHLQVSSAGHAIVQPGVLELDRLASIQTARLLGRSDAGLGAPAALTASQARSLLNVANGATANSSDAALLARGNHTGQQLASTISDFEAAVSAYALTLAGGTFTGPISFTGAANRGIRLACLTATEIAALSLGAGDKGVLLYNVTHNRAELQTPSGLQRFLMAGGDPLLADGSTPGTGRQELGRLNLGAWPALTIADGSITAARSAHRVARGADPWELHWIYGGVPGDLLRLAPSDGAFQIVHEAGNVRCAGGADLEMASAYDLLVGIYDWSGWWRVGKLAGDPAPPPSGGHQNNLAAESAPGTGNDSTQGYSGGSLWRWAYRGLCWHCVDPAAGAARWELVGLVTQSILVALPGDAIALDTDINIGFPPVAGRIVDMRATTWGLPVMSPPEYGLVLKLSDVASITMAGIAHLSRSASEHGSLATPFPATPGQTLKAVVSGGAPQGLQITLSYVAHSL